MIKLPDCAKLIKNNLFLLPALAAPAVIFAFTLGRYYGFYYDNHYFNLLALGQMESFRPYLYIGSHYSIHSALYSYLVLPFFYIFGPTDLSMELAAAIFHLATIVVCYRLGRRFLGRVVGLAAAYLVALAPIYLVNIYTWSEYGLVGFLNISAIYYYVCALEERSARKAALAAVFYSLSCLQAVYSLLLAPFFLIFWLLYMVIARHEVPKQSQKIEIAQPVASPSNSRLLRSPLRGSLAMTGEAITKPLLAMTIRIGLLFFAIVAVILLAAEVFVQLDMNFFGRYFGYYRDTTFAGGFGTARPPLYIGGRPLVIFGRNIYVSVLSSLLTFSSGYSKVALNLFESSKIMVSYYRKCYPAAINLFFLIGLTGLLAEIIRKKLKRKGLSISQILPLAWLLGLSASFVNVYPYHILRIYILPMPYFFAALGVKYIAYISAYAFGARRRIFGASLAALVLFLSLDQFSFCLRNIFYKYKQDKSRSNYYTLYHGWPYGRGYKEVGDFLLKDAPLKNNGKFRSIFVYTISPYTAVNICALFFNAIDWYTRDKIKIIYDDIHTSYNKYGTPERLRRYLSGLFSDYPEAEAVYFADFYDNKDNFSFFTKAHPGIRPYKIVDDDGRLDYDCILYKFEKRD